MTNVNDLVNEAHELIEQGELYEAKRRLNKAIIQGPTSQVFVEYAMIKFLSHDIDGAVERAIKALELNPDNLQAYMVLAAFYNEKKDVPNTVSTLTSALRLDGSDKMHLARGKYCLDQAKSMLNPQLMQNYEPTQPFFEKLEPRVQALLEIALEDFGHVAKNQPTDLETRCNLASCKMHVGKLDEAVAEYDVIIQQQPKNPGNYLDRGLCLQFMEKYGAAISDFTRAIELNSPDPEAFFNRAVCYVNMKEYDKAIADLNANLATKPKQPGIVYALRAEVYARMGNKDLAKQDLQKARTEGVEVDPVLVKEVMG